jgi:hypothetical protein
VEEPAPHHYSSFLFMLSALWLYPRFSEHSDFRIWAFLSDSGMRISDGISPNFFCTWEKLARARNGSRMPLRCAATALITLCGR